jgi:hypothetical protein
MSKEFSYNNKIRKLHILPWTKELMKILITTGLEIRTNPDTIGNELVPFASMKAAVNVN